MAHGPRGSRAKTILRDRTFAASFGMPRRPLGSVTGKAAARLHGCRGTGPSTAQPDLAPPALCAFVKLSGRASRSPC
eukprot:scaffold2221_cov368-Prasinococcus_capsulatus_cf.AAC.1